MVLPIQLDNSYKYVETIDLKELGIRKKIAVFITNVEKEKCLVFHITQKSRFLQKDVDKINEIRTIILENKEYDITLKTIIIESPLCSKAKNKLSDEEWIVLG
jgi:hypothetical protein